MTVIKFCGMTRSEDVSFACELGIDAVGFVMWAGSPRFVSPAQVRGLVKLLPPAVTPVGVFVTPGADEVARARDAGIRVVQLHKCEPPRHAADVWLATALNENIDGIATQFTIVLDAHDPVRHGGTGQTIDWEAAAAVAAGRRVFLAGGLNPQNVAGAVEKVRPYGVDVASGIEERPGIKSAQAMTAFVAAVRRADQ